PACAELADKILAQQYPGAPVDILYAESGMNAFARLQVAIPELIILSGSLSDLTAEAVLQRLAGDPLTAHIPVCLTTPSGEADVLEDRYPNIRKVAVRPMDRDTIAELLAKVVSAPRTQRGGGDGGSQDSSRVAFSGHTGFFKVQAALQMAHGDRLTGVLRFFIDRSPIELYVSKGRFVFATTRNHTLYCKDSTVILDQAGLGQITEAQQGQSISGCPLFMYLGLKGLLPQEDMVPLIREHGHRLFAALWSAGRIPFEFERMDSLPEFAAKFPASGDDADNWVLVSLRHVGMAELPLELRITENGSPVYTRRGAEMVQRLRLSDHESRFASGVNGAESLLSLSKRTAVDLKEAREMVFRFVTLGIMDFWTGAGLPGAALPVPRRRPSGV
ncbi:MAG: hypothetical protein WCL08_05000, partial [Verrucomicrobiota bacterium]